MKIHYLRGACLLIEAGGIQILTDPWLTDGEYYGSWAHYPVYEWQDDLSNIDYIYVSHIHPDHYSPDTMRRLPKVPVLIHKFQAPFLKKNIESLGFEVRELPHNTPVNLGGNVEINILAADDCDPSICGKFFACSKPGVSTAQIDTMAVITSGLYTFVNAVDCPYELSKNVIKKIKLQYPKIDLFACAYAGAGPYPQCFDMHTDVKTAESKKKKQYFLNALKNFTSDLGAKKVMPIAGDYVLCGEFVDYNPYRGVATLFETWDFLEENGFEVFKLLPGDAAGIDWIDTWSNKSYYKEERENFNFEQIKYIYDVLARRKMDYYYDPKPSVDELELLVIEASKRLFYKAGELGFSTKTELYLPLTNNYNAVIQLDGSKKIDFTNKFLPQGNYISMEVNPRLLKRILHGPSYAHWNNAEIGSHIKFKRKPYNNFERGISTVVSYLHT